MTVSDNTIAAEGLDDFFENLGENKLQKRWQKSFENTGRAKENGAIVVTASASRSPKPALSALPEVLNFRPTVKG